MFELDLAVASTTLLWPLGVLLGVVLGMASACLGIGAGLIAVPVLIGLFDIPYPIAVGSSLVLVATNAAMAAYGHHRKGNVDLRLGLLLGSGVTAGAILGGAMLHRLASAGEVEFLGRVHPVAEIAGATLFAVLLTALAGFTWRDVRRAMRQIAAGSGDAQEGAKQTAPAWLARMRLPPRIRLQQGGLEPVSVWPLLAVGCLAGVFAGLMGVGGGFLLVPVLLYWFGARTLLAFGTSLAGILVGAIFATVQKAMLHTVDWTLVGVLFAGGFLGIPVGLAIAQRVPPHELRRAYAIVCFIGAALALSKLLR